MAPRFPGDKRYQISVNIASKKSRDLTCLRHQLNRACIIRSLKKKRRFRLGGSGVHKGGRVMKLSCCAALLQAVAAQPVKDIRILQLEAILFIESTTNWQVRINMQFLFASANLTAVVPAGRRGSRRQGQLFYGSTASAVAQPEQTDWTNGAAGRTGFSTTLGRLMDEPADCRGIRRPFLDA